MSRTVLLEIGVEDFPPLMVKKTLAQVQQKAKELFYSYRIDHGKILTWGTSRRLVLWVEGVAEEQKEQIKKDLGPPKNVIFDEEGNLTPSGKGYLKAKGIALKDLGVQTLRKGEYIYIKRKLKGKRSSQVLPFLFLDLINSLYFAKSMRWEEGNFYFGRPIRSLLALFGEEVINFKIAGVTSAKKTIGHRYLHPKNINVSIPEEYPLSLREAKVIIDPLERKNIILKQLSRIMNSLKEKGYQAEILEDEQLLEDLTYLMEYPTLFQGEFNSEFLSLPPPILKACLRDYQKHFTVRDKDGILPFFIGVREGDERHIDRVVAGNCRVLNARLTDAKFFYDEDRKIPLKERVPSLKEVVVQEKLGSYYKKTQRLVKLAEKITSSLGLKGDVVERIQRAAYLCKADLLTNVVKEFPELQGMMGKEYTLCSGEDPRVAEAIAEHRLPQFSKDRLPHTFEGAVVAIIDKMDTLAGAFWIDFVPSGSEDPWGLRREAQGVAEIILNRGWGISLKDLIEESINLYGGKETHCKETQKKLKEFFKIRLINLLREKKLSPDQIKAVVEVGIEYIARVVKRGESLKKIALRKNFREEVIAIVRLLNMSKHAEKQKISIPLEVREDLLLKEEEKKLYSLYQQIKEKVEKLLSKENYKEAYEELSCLKEPIHKFFEEILVMSEDKKLKCNRLALLKGIGDSFNSIADFTQLQVK
ncbi:glycine--tRNA ligase subunit beta [Patescibacteria group bacterium]|nr:glycine--tRNA ligase subunit beta [Patescibacteria group bacterium]